MIAENLLHFARILRTAGLSVGPDRVLAAMAAVEAVGLNRRDDVHAALSAVMLDRHEQQSLFDAVFDVFWRDPKLLNDLLQPKGDVCAEQQRRPRANDLAEALAALRDARTPRPLEPPNNGAQEEIEFEASFTFSERERLQQADFESMTAAEFELAKKLAEQLPLPVDPVRRRRHEAATRGSIDLRRTLQRMARQPHTLSPALSRARSELPTLVVLLDVSGSMERYARLLLHYVHGLTRRYVRVHTLTFGTRLTNITRCMKNREPAVALRLADRWVQDWRGGTRIASCLQEFNQCWARRLLGANAALMLMTDGLDRDDQGNLAHAATQLRRHAHQIVWLNPLLRFRDFEPRAAGVRALLPNVDRFLPVHNLASLANLGQVLGTPVRHFSR